MAAKPADMLVVPTRAEKLKERNRKIAEDRNAGLQIADLMEKYDLSYRQIMYVLSEFRAPTDDAANE